jgi:hypothetical protein
LGGGAIVVAKRVIELNDLLFEGSRRYAGAGG